MPRKTPPGKTYACWQAIKSRCQNPNNIGYSNYGAVGVTVCERWQSYKNFLIDMGEKPLGLSLDRIDNLKGYSKDNCRWATRLEQNRNRKNLHMITYRGKTQCLSAWCEELTLPYPGTYRRVVVKGVVPALAFETPFKNAKDI